MNIARSFLLLIGDDGALLLPPHTKGVASALYAPTHHLHDSKALLDRIAQDPPSPVVILADVTTQTIKRETLPDISFFDKRKLLARRLEQTFPKHPLSSTLRDEKNEALFLALDTKGVIDEWIARLKKDGHTVSQFGLLPIESASLVEALAPETRNGWGLLLAAHGTGGIRQIVTHKGRFVFTRLTRAMDPQSDSQSQAASLVQDIKATRDYLTRLGLKIDMPLCLVGILPAPLCAQMREAPLTATTQRFFTPYEAAHTLNLTTTPPIHHATADLISLLWVAEKRSLRAPLIPEPLRTAWRSAVYYRYAKRAAGWLFALSLMCALWQSAMLVAPVQELNAARASVVKLQSDLHTAQDTLAPAAEPLIRLQRAAERQRLFTTDNLPLLNLAEDLNAILNTTFRLQSFHWQGGILTITSRLTDEKSFKNQEVAPFFERLLQDFRTKWPTWKIDMTQAPTAALSSDSLSNQDNHAQPTTATYVIDKRGDRL